MLRPPPTAPPDVALRRRPTPAQARILALIAEAPSYKRIGALLHLRPLTVRNTVRDIADLLPADFAPDGSPKERVILYAIRRWALSEIARARQSAA